LGKRICNSDSNHNDNNYYYDHNDNASGHNDYIDVDNEHLIICPWLT